MIKIEQTKEREVSITEEETQCLTGEKMFKFTSRQRECKINITGKNTIRNINELNTIEFPF